MIYCAIIHSSLRPQKDPIPEKINSVLLPTDNRCRTEEQKDQVIELLNVTCWDLNTAVWIS